MKKMEKVLAMILSLAMVLAMSVTAFAASDDPVDPTVKNNATGKTEDRGTITIDGLASSDVTVTAYRIIKAEYNNNSLFSGYNTTYTGEPTVTFKNNNGVQEIRGQIDNLDYLNKVIPVVKGSSFDSKEIYTNVAIEANGDDNYKATFSDLPVGSYVVLISGTESNTYNPIIASIYYDVDAAQIENVLQQGNVNLLGTNAWAKISNSPDVEKKIVEDNNKKDSDDAKIGDVITYQVEINPIPEYQGNYPVLNVTDTLGGGLVLESNTNNIRVEKVKPGEPENVEPLDAKFYTTTIATDKKSLNVDFVPEEGGYQLNDLAGEYFIRITYQAKLTAEGAEYNQNANENEVVLKYTKDSTTDAGDNPPTKKDKTYTYTFDLDIDGGITKKIITKTGDATEEDQEGLAGAEFTLYKSREGAEKNDANDKYSNEAIDIGDGEWTNPISSNKDGQLPIRGLAAGTYYLKETKAPDGYSLNTHVYKIEIGAIKYDEEDGKITEWAIKVDDRANTFTVTYTSETDSEGNEVIKANVELNNEIVVNGGTMTENYDGEHANETEIKNTTLTDLPSTGGIGTTIFTIGGCIIMIVAAGLFFASRRKKAEN